jgi:transketolase
MKKIIIKKIIEVAYLNKEGHIPSSLSILDILYCIYDNINKEDVFILSKGHASLGLYAILDHFNLLNAKLDSFCKFDSIIGGHPTTSINGVEASTGSLGHGLPIGFGIALGKKIKNVDGIVYVLIGDGEANEGTIWETALLAANHKMNNLICLMDNNHSTNRALNIFDIKSKFKSFGWDTIEIDGHDMEQIYSAINLKSDKPLFILCNTIKGKGCSLMENNPEWHHKIPNQAEYNQLMKDLT